MLEAIKFSTRTCSLFSTACHIFMFQQYYLPSARELARLVGVHQAPVIQHFAETISGSTTIRSFGQEYRFRETNMMLIDGSSRPKFHSFGVREWLTFRLDILSSLTFAFSLVFLISVPNGTIDPSMWFDFWYIMYFSIDKFSKLYREGEGVRI